MCPHCLGVILLSLGGVLAAGKHLVLKFKTETTEPEAPVTTKEGEKLPNEDPDLGICQQHLHGTQYFCGYHFGHSGPHSFSRYCPAETVTVEAQPKEEDEPARYDYTGEIRRVPSCGYLDCILDQGHAGSHVYRRDPTGSRCRND